MVLWFLLKMDESVNTVMEAETRQAKFGSAECFEEKRIHVGSKCMAEGR